MKFSVECEIQGRMWNSELNVKFMFQHGIIMPNVKLLSVECECECDGNFYVAENALKISVLKKMHWMLEYPINIRQRMGSWSVECFNATT